MPAEGLDLPGQFVRGPGDEFGDRRLRLLEQRLQERLDDHLRDNAWSRALVDGLSAGDAELTAEAEARMLKRVIREGRPVSTRGGSWLRLALAGGGLAAATLAVMLRTSPAVMPATDAGHVAETAAAPPVAPGKPAVSVAATVVFDKPEVKVAMSSLTWRGAASSGDEMLRDFKPAFDAYRAGDYPRAVTEFARLERAYPQAVEPPFYLGVSRMLAGDFKGAVAPLSAPTLAQDETFAADAAWCLAVTELRLGRVREARERMAQLCAGRKYQAACAVLPTLPVP